jgi:hypothetical protein
MWAEMESLAHWLAEFRDVQGFAPIGVRRSRKQDVEGADADMLVSINSGFSGDASFRITLIDQDVPSYVSRLELLLFDCD